ncbi:MAG: hypothetical protein ABIJ57_16215 [Pseudomonadota bacterium]
MEFKKYLSFVGKKLEEASNIGDKEEWIRIATVLIDSLSEQIRKLKN